MIWFIVSLQMGFIGSKVGSKVVVPQLNRSWSPSWSPSKQVGKRDRSSTSSLPFNPRELTRITGEGTRAIPECIVGVRSGAHRGNGRGSQMGLSPRTTTSF